MTFIRTTAINKILSIKKRKKIIQGGTSAGKTFGIIPILVDIAIKCPNKEISIVSESFPHLRRGAIKDFQKIMQLTGRWNDKCWHSSVYKYTFLNGSYIEFFSADNESRLRGARRNILYVNEANNIDFSSYYQLAIRTNEDIFIDFNPSMEFWAHTEVENDEDAELIILTYKDNEALDDTIIKEIESAKVKGEKSDYWMNWWNVYGLGKIGSLSGAVFTNWKQVNEVSSEAKLLGYGLDFGYSVDPTACVALYKLDGDLIVEELICQKEMSNQQIARFLRDKCEVGYPVIADSAEPKSIAEIFSYGVNIFPCKKGKDSIAYSIQLLQSHEMHITKNSLNLIKELRGYLWEKQKDGSKSQRPLGHVPDHCLDALRYIAMDKLGYQEDEGYSVY